MSDAPANGPETGTEGKPADGKPAGTTTAPASGNSGTGDGKPAEGSADAKAIAAERDALAKQLADAQATIKAAEDAKLSESEKATKAAAEATARADKAEAEVLRLTVLAEKAVPANLAEFVSGANKKDLEASAEKVLAAFKASTGDTGNPGGTPPGTKPRPNLHSISGDGEGKVELDPAKLAASVPRRNY